VHTVVAFIVGFDLTLAQRKTLRAAIKAELDARSKE
jgi:hypothetical protein